MFCRQCGTKLEEDAKFCGKCGAKNDDGTLLVAEKKSKFKFSLPFLSKGKDKPKAPKKPKKPKAPKKPKKPKKPKAPKKPKKPLGKGAKIAIISAVLIALISAVVFVFVQYGDIIFLNSNITKAVTRTLDSMTETNEEIDKLPDLLIRKDPETKMSNKDIYLEIDEASGGLPGENVYSVLKNMSMKFSEMYNESESINSTKLALDDGLEGQTYGEVVTSNELATFRFPHLYDNALAVSYLIGVEETENGGIPADRLEDYVKFRDFDRILSNYEDVSAAAISSFYGEIQALAINMVKSSKFSIPEKPETTNVAEQSDDGSQGQSDSEDQAQSESEEEVIAAPVYTTYNAVLTRADLGTALTSFVTNLQLDTNIEELLSYYVFFVQRENAEESKLAIADRFTAIIDFLATQIAIVDEVEEEVVEAPAEGEEEPAVEEDAVEVILNDVNFEVTLLNDEYLDSIKISTLYNKSHVFAEIKVISNASALGFEVSIQTVEYEELEEEEEVIDEFDDDFEVIEPEIIAENSIEFDFLRSKTGESQVTTSINLDSNVNSEETKLSYNNDFDWTLNTYDSLVNFTSDYKNILIDYDLSGEYTLEENLEILRFNEIFLNLEYGNYSFQGEIDGYIKQENGDLIDIVSLNNLIFVESISGGELVMIFEEMKENASELIDKFASGEW